MKPDPERNGVREHLTVRRYARAGVIGVTTYVSGKASPRVLAVRSDA
jgi:hypothetical protein